MVVVRLYQYFLSHSLKLDTLHRPLSLGFTSPLTFSPRCATRHSSIMKSSLATSQWEEYALKMLYSSRSLVTRFCHLWAKVGHGSRECALGGFEHRPHIFHRMCNYCCTLVYSHEHAAPTVCGGLDRYESARARTGKGPPRSLLRLPGTLTLRLSPTSTKAHRKHLTWRRRS